VTQEFRIDPEINERLLMEGFVLDSITANPNTVAVTGPKSVIDAISFVKASVSGEQDLDKSFAAEANVRVLANDLTKLENVTIEPEIVNVDVKIKEYSKEVPVRIEQNGKPKKGITIDSLKVSEKTVRIYGPKTAVDQIDEYVVEVNTGVITSTDTNVEMELKTPAGTTSIRPGKVTVEADITLDETAELPEGVDKPEAAN
jgi:YbbR domain-containing protein